MNLFVGVVTHRTSRWPQLFSLLRAQEPTELPVRYLFVDGGSGKLASHLIGSGLTGWTLLPTPARRSLAAYREEIRRYVYGRPGYLAFVDDDDYFSPNHLSTLVRRALAHEEAWCVGVRDVVLLSPDGRVARTQAATGWPVFQSSCFSTSSIDLPFRDSPAEDTTWISGLRARNGSPQIVENDGHTYFHTIHGSNTVNRLKLPDDAPRWADVEHLEGLRLPAFDPSYSVA